jgi:hypothetical protein
MSAVERAAWKLRRTLAMSPPEVGLRALRGARRRLGRPATPRPQEAFASPERVVRGALDAKGADRRVLESLASSRGSLLPGACDRRALRSGLEAIGVDPEGVVSAAEAVLDGRVPAFGWAEFDIGPDPDWHKDPLTGERWGLEFWADVNLHGGGRPAEPRLCWEINRHHQLVTLARAHVLTGEARFAEAVWRQMGQWISANPPLFGINWSSPLEIALRLISWCMALDLIGGEGAREGAAGRVAVSAALQARHVHDNLTVYASSKNNHLIGEAAGLAVAGAKLRFLVGSDRWARAGAALVDREVPAQVAPDGASREQTCHYGAFVLELSLAVRAGLRILGRPPGRRFDQAVGRMADFLSSVSGPGGVPPSIGDDDGGRVLGLSDQELDRQPIRAAETARAALGARTAAVGSPRDLEPAVWLLGPDEVARWLRARVEDGAGGRPEAARAFEESGYYVLGGGEHHGVIDCGPLGYLSTAAHGHADCLSFAAWHSGRWVIVDPGTYCYQADRSLRDHFRSTWAHNTVRVDGRDQSEMMGPFLWGRRARPSPLAWAVGPGWQYFEGEHDGYARRGVIHRRSVVHVASGYWVVVDLLLGSGSHDVSATFQLAEGMTTGGPRGQTFTDGDGRAVRIVPWLPRGFEVAIVEGRAVAPGGWVSPGFGLKRPAPALVAAGRAALPAALVFAIVPSRRREAPEVTCPSGPLVGGVEIVATVPGGRDRLLFGTVHGAGGRFAGRFGFIEERRGRVQASGLDVSEWTLGDASFGYARVENQLRGRERSRVTT